QSGPYRPEPRGDRSVHQGQTRELWLLLAGADLLPRKRAGRGLLWVFSQADSRQPQFLRDRAGRALTYQAVHNLRGKRQVPRLACRSTLLSLLPITGAPPSARWSVESAAHATQ